jgi:hypothetical protein
LAPNIQHLCQHYQLIRIWQRNNFTLVHFNNNDDNAVQFFIIYVPSQQLQEQLQTQHSVDTGINNNNNNVKNKSYYSEARKLKYVHLK